MINTYNSKFPSVKELKIHAKKRIPKFAYNYLDGGIDDEKCKEYNRKSFDEIKLIPRYLQDIGTVNTKVTLFGHDYNLPIGIAPVGLGSMMWPGAEMALAKAAQNTNIPYILSTFSTTLLEDIAKVAPDVCWYQLYLPKDNKILKDIIKRVKQAKYNALIITIDIPTSAKRNKEIKDGLQIPLEFSSNIFWEFFSHPKWSIETFKQGMPKLVNVTSYKKNTEISFHDFISDFMVTGVTKEHIKKIRKLWDGPLILKGIQDPNDILEVMKLGIDGIIISNHGGRQLDAAPSSIESIQRIPDKIKNKLTIMLDSGVRTGLDVIRAKSLGAEMVFSGRSFYWGVTALGNKGASQVIEIYRDEITRTLKQIGCHDFNKLDHTWLN